MDRPKDERDCGEREIRLGARVYAGAAVTLAGLAITLAPRKARTQRGAPQSTKAA